MSKTKASVEDGSKSMREIVQKKFLDDVIGGAAAKCSGWMVLVLDDAATRVISSALTMFDIMERRVTLVEQLARKRQPFPEMDVVYLVSPTMTSVRTICADFESNKKARYANAHIFFLDTMTNDMLGVLQQNSTLTSRLKTLKEVQMDFVSMESNVFQLDQPRGLSRIYGTLPDPQYASVVGHKLATLCISLNEHPSIRYQGSSSFCREVANTLHQTLSQYKKTNGSIHWVYGDDGHTDRDRGSILILDRTFDPLSPSMHEYTYQAMVTDLLGLDNGAIEYTVTANNGVQQTKKALLNEADELWLELRHSHIAKVIEVIKERMQDIIQNNAGAALSKSSGADMSITHMAAAVKELPEYRQTMSKLSMHVSIAQQCMDAFGKQGLMNLSQLEQTMSTGVDEEGKAVKLPALVQSVGEALRSNSLDRLQKVRLLAIFIVSQRGASSEDRKQLVQASRLSGDDQQILVNIDRLCLSVQSASSSSAGTKEKSSGIFSSMFKGLAPVHEATAEGAYADTRHIGQLKGLVEQLMNGDLPTDKYPAVGPAAAGAGSISKSAAKSVRRVGANARWGRKETGGYTGGRAITFVAGGVAFSELRVVSEIMTQQNKEVIIGGSHLIDPDTFINDVMNLDAPFDDAIVVHQAAAPATGNV